MIYFISGLGADERVFSHLNLGGLEYKYLKWEPPKKNEKLEDYCRRLITQIDLSGEIVLIGVSFGGIVAQEVSKIIKTKKVIIISSVKSVNEFDWHLELVRKLKFYKLAPSRFLKWSNKLTGNYYFGVKTRIESELLKRIINDTDRFFMKWAIGEIMKWKGDSSNQSLVHIHGEKDRIFPIKRIRNCVRIKDGGHFMIINRSNEISELIKNEIKKQVYQS